MNNTYQQQHDSQLQKIIAALPQDASPDFKHFTAGFFAKMHITDLEKLLPQAAVLLAQNAFEFMALRKFDTPKISISKAGKHIALKLLNNDMPFLVDSLSAELTRRGFIIYDTIHPIFHVLRDENGGLTGFADKNTANVKAESLIHFEISALPEDVNEEQLTEDLLWVLEHIKATVEDWQLIADKAKEIAVSLDKTHADSDEVRDFLLWLVDKNFVFLGSAEYQFFDDKGHETLSVLPDSRLGILKIDNDGKQRGLEALPAEQRHFLLVPQLIEITKSNRRSLVHRSVPMDYIGIKHFDESGKIIGETRFLGLFTSNVYYQSTEAIPLVRLKIARVLERSDFEANSHDGKSLKTILEFLPRDEIFQISDEELFETSMGILALEAKPKVRLFARKDAFERFVSTMVFVPRERFSTEMRHQIQEIMEKAYNGVTSSFSTQINEAPLARLHLIIRTASGDVPAVNLKSIEQEIAKRAYLWTDLLMDCLLTKHDENKAEKLSRDYGKAFPQAYINRYNPTSATYDIDKIEQAFVGGGLSLELFRNNDDDAQVFHLKIYNPNEEIALSDILPMLENAGFRVIEEQPFLITPQNATNVWIRDFTLQNTSKNTVNLEQIKPLLEQALLQVWQGKMESDKFNSLVLLAGLNYLQVTMLRAYAKYLKQAGFSHSQATIEQAFIAYPSLTKNIVELFENRFNPSSHAVDYKIPTAELDQVSSAVHDKILRRYIDLINATLRTNYFQQKPVLSFKFNSALVPELPKPVPYAEIFVYSARVEGIHLRGGKVARGGLRWSDRADDFRTEVLGLMKAQMVKNSVIVPVGSKGGFFVKKPPVARDAMMAEGIECYKLYLSGLLDITDNIVAGKVVSPAQCVRHDGEDPYLVVAADKGTASFSDIANSVSHAYNFWLGDAFASGGSVGYDHKKMAITARGAFISVHRHFAEMGVDIDTTPFTVAGIGDMAGDVFGNGMLLSKNIRLVAAFNHLHIFLDPNPNEKTSFVERQRLFNLLRSNWTDYDAKLISTGGGVFERSAKSIVISEQAMQALGVEKNTFTPDELMKAILLAPVDLLWNGGIGTYAKAEDEANEQVGDRANNAVRVNGRELRAKIIGEGGNLGFTQKGRIEYAKNGGRINTDAIDNSAGVDCSDHEVNIKIAFSGEVSSGKLALEKRDAILASMTDEVAELVLNDNILQTQAITIAQARSAELLESHEAMMHQLEKEHLLDRSVEFLPTDKQIAELKLNHKGLTRPELAVLLSYSKMVIYTQVLASKLPDDNYLLEELKNYFPKAMRNEFLNAIENHQLRREIIATTITNNLVNRAGISFAFDIARDLNVAIADVGAAFVAVRDLFNLCEVWQKNTDINELQAVQLFLGETISWLLRNVKKPHGNTLVVSEIIADFATSISELQSDRTASLESKATWFDVIQIARTTGGNIADVGVVYSAIGTQLHFANLLKAAKNISCHSLWERLAVQELIGELYGQQQRITTKVLTDKQTVEAWLQARQEAFASLEQFASESGIEIMADIAKITVAIGYLRAIA